jgi:reelin-like protein
MGIIHQVPGRGFSRAAATVPLNIIQLGYLEFKLRAGNQTLDGAAYWNDSETGETLVMEYSLDGSTWTTFQSLNTMYPNLSSWTSFFVQVPAASQTYFTDAGLSPNTWYQYRIRASNAGGVSLPSSTSLSATLSRIAEWRLQNYGTTASTGTAASTATGRDGIANLAKYAFNMQSSEGTMHVQPGTGDRGLPTTEVNPSTQRLRVEFIRRKSSSAPGVSYEVEFCSDLKTFVPAGAAVQIDSIDANLERVIWEDSMSLSESPTRFARVKVVENP